MNLDDCLSIVKQVPPLHFDSSWRVFCLPAYGDVASRTLLESNSGRATLCLKINEANPRWSIYTGDSTLEFAINDSVGVELALEVTLNNVELE